MQLSTPIAELTRVGKTTASRLKNLGITTTEDLLHLLPHRYEDYREITEIDSLADGVQTTVQAKIELIQGKRSKVKRMSLVEALISDTSGSMKIIWFNQPYLSTQLIRGEEYYFSGKVKIEFGQAVFYNPSFEKTDGPTRNTARILPVYPTTQGVTQKQLRFLISQALPLASELPEVLPERIIDTYNFPSRGDAYKYIHTPTNEAEYTRARERFLFTKLFIFQLLVQRIKQRYEKHTAFAIPLDTEHIKTLVDSLPFPLTGAQRRAAWEICQDMAEEKPMSRMLIGDVGSGKTLVAAIALLHTVMHKYQGALIVPTEILAEQHYHTLTKYLATFPIKIALYTRSKSFLLDLSLPPEMREEKRTKKELLNKIKKQEVDIIISTHALFHTDIEWQRLGLVVVDEQHRFGVEQRRTLLAAQQIIPHFLSMTATPIPRSLALTLYGHVKLSILDELPPGRTPIDTRLIEPHKEHEAYECIRTEVEKGRQVFVVCPLIDESDTLGVRSVSELYTDLSKNIFPNMKIEMLHGKLKSQEKEEIMSRFIDNESNILISTSVIEVGVDVPNASVMTIMGAERFGLAQLHQFRGRVGRGAYASICLLLPTKTIPQAMERLRILCRTNSGFTLAEYDLKNRGSGQLYGIQQSGMDDLLNEVSFSDIALIEKAKKEAENIILNDPGLNNYPLLKQLIEEKEQSIHLE